MTRQLVLLVSLTALCSCHTNFGETLQALKSSDGAHEISVAGIKAQADEEIAHTNAEAEIKMFEIRAEKQKYVDKQRAEAAKAQLEADAKIEHDKQEAQNRMLAIQLKAWRESRKPAKADDESPFHIQ